MTQFTGYLQIDPNDLDDLLAALRRHDRPNVVRLLDRWASAECDPFDDPDDDCWDDDMPMRFLDHPLTGWVHREVSAHVADDRFEHALCLIERYRRDLTVADMAARLTFAAGASQ
jgi:hypothetical protein